MIRVCKMIQLLSLTAVLLACLRRAARPIKLGAREARHRHSADALQRRDLSKAKPLEKFISEGLGGKTAVQIYVPSSYAAVVESLRFGHAHVAFMSAWPAQLAVRLGGADVPLAEVRQVIHR